MKRKSRIIFVFVALLLLGNVAKPVSEESARFWGIGVGGTIAAASLLISLGGAVIDADEVSKYMLTALGGVGIGALAGYILYKILLYNTPKKRFLRAEKLIEDISSDSLIIRDFDSVKDLIKHVTVRFESSWPLVLARKRFRSMARILNDASELLCEVYDEAKTDDNLKSLCKKCGILKRKIYNISKLIENRMAIIVEHTNYNFQVSLYLKHKEEEKKRRQKERESMMKLQMHQDKMRQKERERQQKEDFLAGHHGNVNVNVTL